MHHGAALNSIPAGEQPHPAQNPGQSTAAAAPARGGSAGTGSGAGLVDTQPQRQRDAAFLGREGEIWKLVPLNAAGGYF